MKRKLFQEAFRKAENQCGNNTKHGLSSHLENFFTDDLKFSVSKMTFVRYYEKYVEEGNGSSSNPSADLLNKISEYLDYKNYEDFVSKNNSQKGREILTKSYSSDEEKNKVNILNVFFKKNRITIIISSLLLFCFFVFYSINKERWMIWNNNHYMEVKFNLEKYNLGKIKSYNEERIKYFKLIVPDCSTEFFGLNNEVKIWYGKNHKKELEYFTALGLHPETGKTLDPITTYMIKKYICSNYRN